MHHSRYIVLNRQGWWQIVQVGRRLPASYASKAEATSAAIEFAEKDGDAGRGAEVVVCHEDGRFLTEWVFGETFNSDKPSEPLITPRRP